MLCWDTLGPGIHVDAILMCIHMIGHGRRPRIPVMTAASSSGSMRPAAKTAREQPEEHLGELKASIRPANSTFPSPITQPSGHGGTSLTHRTQRIGCHRPGAGPQGTPTGPVSMPRWVRAALRPRRGPRQYQAGGFTVLADRCTLQGNETLFVLCRFYLFLKYRRVNVQKDKEFHQELYNIYTLFFPFFMEN